MEIVAAIAVIDVDPDADRSTQIKVASTPSNQRWVYREIMILMDQTSQDGYVEPDANSDGKNVVRSQSAQASTANLNNDSNESTVTR